MSSLDHECPQCGWAQGSSSSGRKRAKHTTSVNLAAAQPLPFNDERLLAEQGFIQLPPRMTHETSAASFHLRDLQCLTTELEAALEASWATRKVPGSPYNAVKVLLTSWMEDDLGVESEIDQLKDLFERVYRYDVDIWKIPSEKSERALIAKTSSLLDECELTKSLLIFYYAGHARPSMHLGTYPVWTS
ncbi:hypothetical protein GQ53DRAFT_865528 [Thozetella sp. PMI_491]|nr:hypothetical protein GQ53DRAFT_865528 [Thozetella sp. PMI_491]